MKNGYLTDFFFTGLGVTPPLLTLGGHLDVAIMMFCPLLVAAVLSGIHEGTAQAGADDESGSGRDSAPVARPASVVTRERRRTRDSGE